MNKTSFVPISWKKKCIFLNRKNQTFCILELLNEFDGALKLWSKQIMRGSNVFYWFSYYFNIVIGLIGYFRGIKFIKNIGEL